MEDARVTTEREVQLAVAVGFARDKLEGRCSARAWVVGGFGRGGFGLGQANGCRALRTGARDGALSNQVAIKQ